MVPCEINGSRGQCEAILDLGADTSVLPLDFAAFNEVEDASFKATLSDAQGNAIHNKDKVRLTLMVYTHNGSCIALKETFVQANVKQPLIALGKWLKKGWDLQKTKEISSGHFLVGENYKIPLPWQWYCFDF